MGFASITSDTVKSSNKAFINCVGKVHRNSNFWKIQQNVCFGGDDAGVMPLAAAAITTEMEIVVNVMEMEMEMVIVIVIVMEMVIVKEMVMGTASRWRHEMSGRGLWRRGVAVITATADRSTNCLLVHRIGHTGTPPAVTPSPIPIPIPI